ncbi:sensor histidine kinase [Paenibacillus radicis (ex Gao et al. 2016)]|uniref:histidine kinase n=1 Tax=Paenibacillus radicis (ex Gao et al. 2016) TaxID=1737354 RepID=A0A917H8Q3_9BACL|nr:HAMP domain-containing sensor histidine kinase [Paenibacillus radicis (ex Gao et al. 2016)]GGG70938.1 two-component sensor histidine kinase [Paenibacillus radicis (ex Gao et al. 2016)]
MSIRFRLLLSFMSVVIVSVIVFALAAYSLSVAVTGDFRSISGFYKVHYAVHPLSDEEDSLFIDLKYLAKHDPMRLKETLLLEDYDQQLKMVQAGLVVRDDERILYQTPTLHDVDLIGALPAYDLNNRSIRNTMNVGNRFFSYAKFDFYFSPEEQGSIFVIRERSPFAEVIRTLLPILIGMLAAILLLTGWLLYRYVTRKIIKPLDALRRSAEHITEGDLTFQLHSSSRDEVGQLVLTFDQMRRQLYDSVQLQLHYEENRKQLLSNISHDLRTPITTIKGYAEGIRDGVANTPEKLDKYVGAIHTRASDMEQLVDELLLYSKLDLNKEPFSFEQLMLLPFLKSVVEELAIDFDNERVVVSWLATGKDEFFVLADREKLKRVVVNLLSNCLKYMVSQPKRITIGMEEKDGFAIVQIKDNGPGIHPDALPHIFERFYREEPSRSKAAGGSGLGLAIAKQIIEGHGGEIGAESLPQQGTTIYFTLKIFEDRR